MMLEEQAPDNLAGARRLIWLYCIVWLIEGAVRKWIVPSLSLQLLLVRDPIVLLIYWSAIKARVFPSNGWMTFFWFISAAVSIQAFLHLFSSDASVPVIAFGVRTFILHLPLIWVVPAVLGRKDIVTLGKWILYIAPFLAVLMVIQFKVGPDHWLNAASLKGGAQIGSVFGKIRPPAVFSFISGPIHYFALVTAFAMGGVLTEKLYPKWLLAVAAISVMMAMSVSASRSLVLGCILVTAAGTMAGLTNGKRAGAVVGLAIGLFVGVIALASVGVMKEGVAAFMDRWSSEEDSGASGGRIVTDRVGGSFSSAFDWAGRVPIGGLGVGLSSNLATERNNFVSGVEGEWERVIYEVGPITGFAYLGFRAALAIHLILLGLGAIRTENFLCFLLGSACFFDIITGNVRQVTSYGYIGMCAGLCLAAHRAFGKDAESDESGGAAMVAAPVVLERPRMRGRGPLAVGGNSAPS